MANKTGKPDTRDVNTPLLSASRQLANIELRVHVCNLLSCTQVMRWSLLWHDEEEDSWVTVPNADADEHPLSAELRKATALCGRLRRTLSTLGSPSLVVGARVPLDTILRGPTDTTTHDAPREVVVLREAAQDALFGTTNLRDFCVKHAHSALPRVLFDNPLSELHASLRLIALMLSTWLPI